MIEFDGISFNELISRRIMGELAGHDPSYSDLAQDQVPNRVTRFSFMAAIAKTYKELAELDVDEPV